MSHGGKISILEGLTQIYGRKSTLRGGGCHVDLAKCTL